MPKMSKATATKRDHGRVLEWTSDLEGYAVNFLCFRQDTDQTPLFEGLPGNQCTCPHWGYVLRGRLRFRVGDHEEVFEEGDAFYLPAGHVPIGNDPDSEYVQFSPAAQLDVVAETIFRNMEAMQAAAQPAG